MISISPRTIILIIAGICLVVGAVSFAHAYVAMKRLNKEKGKHDHNL